MDGEVSGLILLWVKDGVLAALEYAWYSDVPPTEWPDSVNVTVRLSGS